MQIHINTVKCEPIIKAIFFLQMINIRLILKMWPDLIIAGLNARAHPTILTSILEKPLHKADDMINIKRHDLCTH